VFRAAPDQPDRAEEFLQIGVERFAPTGSEADDDLDDDGPSLAPPRPAGGGDLSLWLGDVALFAAFVEGLDLPPA